MHEILYVFGGKIYLLLIFVIRQMLWYMMRIYEFRLLESAVSYVWSFDANCSTTVLYLSSFLLHCTVFVHFAD
jgi:hypothetical protein